MGHSRIRCVVVADVVLRLVVVVVGGVVVVVSDVVVVVGDVVVGAKQQTPPSHAYCDGQSPATLHTAGFVSGCSLVSEQRRGCGSMLVIAG